MNIGRRKNHEETYCFYYVKSKFMNKKLLGIFHPDPEDLYDKGFSSVSDKIMDE